MSVNEVCRRAGISKPGLYREFGGEDGLLAAVLHRYDETVIQRLREHLNKDKPFAFSLQQVMEELLKNSSGPQGCLLAELRLARAELGEASQSTLDEIVEKYLAMWRAWLTRQQSNGHLSETLDLSRATDYLDGQLQLAAIHAQRSVATSLISERFMMSLKALQVA